MPYADVRAACAENAWIQVFGDLHLDTVDANQLRVRHSEPSSIPTVAIRPAAIRALAVSNRRLAGLINAQVTPVVTLSCSCL